MEITGSEEITDSTEEVVELNGLALEIATVVENLKDVVGEAIDLESGLDTKSAINKAAVSLRDELLTTSVTIRNIYKGVLAVKKNLIENVTDVQAAASKEALIASIEAAQAKLATM